MSEERRTTGPRAAGRHAVWPGRPYPLGTTWDGEGVNFALFSEHAEGVELCLFTEDGRHETARIPVRWQTDQVWHCYLPEARPGWLYGYRVYGPYDPRHGHRFNGHKLLLDPYAKAIAGELRWSNAHFAYRVGHKLEVLMVLGELHIGQRLIRDSFLILLGGVTLAAALAFGLGGRRWAAHVLERDWPRERQQGIGEGLDRR